MEPLEVQVPRPPQPPARRASAPVEADERAARRSLRDQIAALERDLADALLAAYPHAAAGAQPTSRGGPRVLGLGDLEELRDELVARLLDARAALREREEFEARHRALLEGMLADPAAHKHVRIACADVGTPGCGHYRVRPRMGPIGRLMGWWQVTLSSGCPLAAGPR